MGQKITVVNHNTGELKVETNVPSESELLAEVSTLRSFLQRSDPTSLARLAKTFSSTSFPPEICADFHKARNRIVGYLQEPMGLSWDDEAPTHEDVFEVFTNGFYFHSDIRKYARYQKWMSDSYLKADLTYSFYSIVLELVIMIGPVQKAVRRAIRHIEEAGPTKGS